MPRERILQTARLVLTTWTAADVDGLAAVHGDEQTMRFVRHGRAETPAETAALVDQYTAEHAARGFTTWRLADHDDRLVGRAGFGRHGDDRELGYTIRRELWGRGFATEIAGALVTWHRTHAADLPLRAIAAVENHASRRVLEKVGFVDDGPTTHHGVSCRSFRLRVDE